MTILKIEIEANLSKGNAISIRSIGAIFTRFSLWDKTVPSKRG
jgi:hypothetical protein